MPSAGMPPAVQEQLQALKELQRTGLVEPDVATRHQDALLHVSSTPARSPCSSSLSGVSSAPGRSPCSSARSCTHAHRLPLSTAASLRMPRLRRRVAGVHFCRT